MVRRVAGRRAARPAWTRRIARLVPVLVIAGLLAAVPLGVRAAYRQAGRLQVFAVTEVRVSGLKHVRLDDFLKYLDEPRGESLLALDLGEMVWKVAAHPWIKDVSVRRELPHTLRIEVAERTPAAVAATGDGRFLIDDEGLALARLDSGGWDVLPVIECPRARGLKVVDEASAAGFRRALDLLGSIRREPTEGLSGARVVMDADGSPSMVVEGTVVKVGDGGYDDKLRRLAEVSEDIRKRGVNPVLIDLRFPGKVVVKGDGAQAG